jgi:pinoresinol/lariciresinol reductase
VVFVDEDDVATYTIKSIDDPRALIYLRPQDNILTQNDVITKWEKLSGKTLEKVHITADEFLASMKGRYKKSFRFQFGRGSPLVLSSQ